MDDVRAIEQVFVDYFDRVDANDPDGAAALFLPDARVEIMTGKVYESSAHFARGLAKVLGQYERTSHHVSNFTITLDGDEARSLAYVYAFHRMRATGDTWHLWGRIDDRMQRTTDGWRIAEHVLYGVDSEPRWDAIAEDWYRGHPGRRAP